MFIPGEDVLHVPQAYRKYKVAEWWSQRLETDKQGKSTCIRAYWSGDNGNITMNPVHLCAGEIAFFFSQNVLIEQQFKEVVMVKVRWFQEHRLRNIQNLDPVEIWSKDLYKLQGPAS